jgi:hypothetical protein
MLRTVTTTLILILLAVPAFADDKDKAKKPLGTWVREVGDNKVTIVLKADTMMFTMTAGGNSLSVATKYELKDGLLKGTITKIEKNEVGAQVDEGDKFSFKIKVEDGTLTLSELKGKDDTPLEGNAKELIEGEYKKEKEKKEEKKDK